MNVWDPALIPHRVRIIRVGVVATFLVLISFVVFRLLPGGGAIPLHVFLPLWGAAAVVGLAALAAPWTRLFATKSGRLLLYVWSIVDILLITALIGWVPEEDASFFFCYVLTTMFFSLLYSRRAQLSLFIFTATCYGLLYVAGQTEITLADLALRLGLLATMTVLATFSSRELMSGVLKATQLQFDAEQEKSLYQSLVTAQSDMGVGVSIIELSSRRITYANDAFCEIYGYSHDEMLQLTYTDLLADEQQQVAEELKRSREAGISTAEYDRDFVGLRKDGSHVVVDVVSKPLSDDSVVSVIRDVTETRRAQRELRESEELFRAVSELTHDFVYSLRIGPNAGQTWEWATDGFTSVTGYDIADPVINNGPLAFIHPDHQAEGTEFYRRLLSTKGAARHELKILTKAGEERWIEFSAEAVFDAGKQRVTRIFGTAQDVTESKQAERAARDRSEVLQAISDLTSDYAYAARVHADGTISWDWVTDGFQAVTGYLPAEVAELGWLTLFHPEERDRALELLGGLAERPHEPVVADLQLLTKDGSTKHVRLFARSAAAEHPSELRIFGAVQDVTDRKLAERALRESERRYRMLFDRLPVGMFVRRHDGSGLDANPACVAMFGYPDRQTFLATNAFDLYVDPAARDGFVNELVERGEAINEAQFRRLDGTTFWGRMQGRDIRDEAGQSLFIEGAMVDVTEQKSAEQALQHSVTLFRSTIESTWDGLLVVSLDGRIETYNWRFVEMWGLNEEVLASGDDDLALAAVLDRLVDPEAFITRVRELYAQPEEESFDVFALKDGRVLERFSRPMRRDDRIVGRVWSFRDITERRQSAKQLEESVAMLRATMDSIAEGILVVGRNDEVVAYNGRFADMWQVPESVLMRGDRDEVIRLSAQRVKDPQRFLETIGRIREGGVQEQAELIELADGRLIERFTREAGQEGIDRVISFRDITQRKALEEQLRQAQRMEAVGRLAGGIAHDFNNLLTAILGYCELLRTSSDISEEVRNDIQEIDTAAQMGADITAQLLDLSRRRVLRTEVLDVNEIVTNMEPMLSRLIGANVVLDVAISPQRCRVEADRSQIEQILLNLVVNARDALPEGGNVTVETRPVELDAADAAKGLRLAPGPHILLRVTDDGAGIAPDVRDRMFEPFFTTHRGGGSTGLGLSTVYGIVSHYGGHIAVESAPGAGSTFRVYLPAAVQDVVPIARAKAAERWLSGVETILLVEDDDAIRKLTKRSLERYGYHVLEASNGQHALELAAAAATPLDLLLTDVVMPGLSGRDLGVRLTKLQPSLRVLYISGYTGESLARFGDLAWNEDFLSKPFRPDALAAKVREILNREDPHSASR